MNKIEIPFLVAYLLVPLAAFTLGMIASKRITDPTMLRWLPSVLAATCTFVAPSGDTRLWLRFLFIAAWVVIGPFATGLIVRKVQQSADGKQPEQ